MEQISLYRASKAIATFFGFAIVGVETWLNAGHVAAIEGWMSSLVAVVIVASLSAGAALPLAERAWITGQRFKSVGLGVFFVLMAGFSFATSSGRLATKHDGDVVAAKSRNANIELQRQALKAANATVADECKRRGPRCRAAENNVQRILRELRDAPVQVVEEHRANAIASSPLLLPLALQFGGFLFLAYGLAPRRIKPPEIPSQELQVEAANATLSSNEVLLSIYRKIQMSPERKLSTSGRKLAEEFGVPPATFASWVRKWQKSGRIVTERSGKTTLFSLPRRAKLRTVA
jgi:transposase-like protein